MICPNPTCRRKIQVSDSREKENGSIVKRRRRCNNCCQSWTTCETIQPDSNNISYIQPPSTKRNSQPAEIYAEILKLLASLGKSMGFVKNSL